MNHRLVLRLCALIAIAGMLTACGSAKKMLFRHAANMQMLATTNDMKLSEAFTTWLAEKGESNVVVVDLSDHKYVGDTYPRSLVQDALITKLVANGGSLTVVERDADLLNILRNEAEILDYLITQEDPSPESRDRVDRRRRELDNFFSGIADQLADPTITVESSTGEGGPTVTATDMSQRKADLLRNLLDRVQKLYDDDVNLALVGDRKSSQLDVLEADFMVAYRIQHFGVIFRDGEDSGEIDTETYLNLHLRVIDVADGSIEFAENIEVTTKDSVDEEELEYMLQFDKR